MKKRILFPLFLIMTFTIISCSGKKENNRKFMVEPQNPVNGGTLTVYLNPDSTALAGVENIEAFAYFFTDNPDTTIEKRMINIGSRLKAEFDIPTKSRGVIIKFTDGEDKEENNSDKGYVVFIYDKNGNLQSGALADLANAYVGWGRVGGLARDYNKAITDFEKEFSKNRNLKEKYLDKYLTALWHADKKKNEKVVEDLLKSVEVKPQKSDNDYLLLWTWYGVLQKPNKSEHFKDEGLKKFSSGELNKAVLLDRFNRENDYNRKFVILKQIEKKYPDYKKIDDLYDEVAYSISNSGKTKEVIKFFADNREHIHPYYFSYSADKLIKNNNTTEAEKLLKLGAEHAEHLLSSSSNNHSKLMSAHEFESQIKYYLGKIQFLSGTIAEKQNKINLALNDINKAVANTINYNKLPDLFEAEIRLLVKSKKYSKALKEGENYLKTGDATKGMVKELKLAYKSKNGTENGFDEFIGKFKGMAKEMLKTKLKKEMLNEHAPDFTLKTLDGKDVSLHDFKGKIVVIDFWATWCGPCIRSFPGMNKVATQFASDKDVAFLFVNTWERVKDKFQNVNDFAKKNNYKLDFLIDSDNKAVTSFKVKGIPTKFVIGKDGNIRFKSVGFSGNSDGLVEEIKTMIELLK